MNIKKTLNIQGHEYAIQITSSGELVFYQIRYEVDEWNFEVNQIYDDRLTGNVKNPIGLIRVITKEAISLIRQYEPNHVWFEANEDRKFRIYKRLFESLMPSFPEYHYAFDEGRYHLYRLKNT